MGVPEVTLHKLRHYHASLLLRANVNAKVVQQRLGHATVGMTLDTYSHLIPGYDEPAAEVVGDAMRKLMEPPAEATDQPRHGVGSVRKLFARLSCCPLCCRDQRERPGGASGPTYHDVASRTARSRAQRGPE